MNVLVTGGAGYIGSHAVQRLARDGHRVLALDNLFRGHRQAVDRVQSLYPTRVAFTNTDVGDGRQIADLIRFHRIEAVMHFAALAYVGESVEQPGLYYRNNVGAMGELLSACLETGVQRFVFSSSCATYGQPPEGFIPVPETCPQSPVSPYGRTKLIGEFMLRDAAEASRRAKRPFGYAALRYFNVAGADRTGVLGEDHTPESHLIPVVIQAALGQRESVAVFGTDYPTPDGTCIRDYIHVEDLIDAHVRSLERIAPGDELAFNLGIGRGYSVRQIIEAVKRVAGREVKVVEEGRRAGDPPMLYAAPDKARRDLGWSAQVTDLEGIIESAWKWMSLHPRGYRS